MNKKTNDEIGRTGKMPTAAEMDAGVVSCRGIDPKKPIPGCQDGCAGNNIPLGDHAGVEFRLSQAKPELDFSSLADEEYRVYEWADGSEVLLHNPSKLNVSKSGGHRVYTMDGISHYIPSGWKHLWWKVREGCPHFAF